MKRNYEEYEVYVTYIDSHDNLTEEFVGMVSLPELTTPQDYPIELEINGVIWKPQH